MSTNPLFAGVVVHVARQFIGAPFYRGGSSNEGIDGINLVCLSYQLAGFEVEGEPGLVAQVDGDEQKLLALLQKHFVSLPTQPNEQRHLPLRPGDVLQCVFGEALPTLMGLVTQSKSHGHITLVLVADDGVREHCFHGYEDGRYPPFVRQAYRLKGIKLSPLS